MTKLPMFTRWSILRFFLTLVLTLTPLLTIGAPVYATATLYSGVRTLFSSQALVSPLSRASAANASYRALPSWWSLAGPVAAPRYRPLALAGPLDHFDVSLDDTTAAAGQYFTTTVVARDALDVQVGITDTISLATTNGGVISPTSAYLISGTWSGLVSLTGAGVGRTVRAISDTITGGATITIYASNLTTLTVSPASADVTVGAARTFTATGTDAYDNPVSVTPTWQTNGGSVDVGPSATTVFTALTVPAESRLITATDSGVNGIAVVDILHGPVHSFYISPSLISSQTAGENFDLTVEAQDFYNNRATSYSGPFTLTDSTGSIAPTSATLNNGIWNGVVSITVAADDVVITATNGVTEGQSNSFTVLPSDLDRFTVSTIGEQTAGVSFIPTITAFDAWDNVKTDYTGQPDLSDTTGTLSPTQIGAGCFSAGVCQPSLTITRAGSGVYFTVTHGSVFTLSNAFVVTPADLHHIHINSVSDNGGYGYGHDSEVDTHDMDIYDVYPMWAGGYDEFDNYREDVVVDWSGDGVLTTAEFAPSSGISTTLSPAPILSGTGRVSASYDSGSMTDETGDFTVRAPWLIISKSDYPDPVQAGMSNMEYTIVYTNVGNAPAQNVRITDTYDGNVTYAWATAPNDHSSGSYVVWTESTIPVGVSQKTLLVDVASSLSPDTILTNVVEIGGWKLETHAFSGTTVVTSTPDLTVSLSDRGSDPVEAGDTFNLEVTFINSGNAPVDNIVFTLTLDSHLTYQSATASPVVAPSAGTGNRGRWELATLDGPGEYDFLVTVKVDDYMVDGDAMLVRGEIEGDQSSSAYAAEPITVIAPLLALSKSASPSPAIAFDQLIYTLAYSNVGSVTASGLVITDAVPANTSFASCQPAGVCSESEGVVTWQPGNLTAGGDDTVTMVVDVHRNLDTGTELINKAGIRVLATPAYSAAAQITTTVVSSPSLWLGMGDGGASVQAGDELVYTLSYGNNGNGQGYDTTITVTPPASQLIDDAWCPDADCVEGGGQLIYSLGAVAGGETGSVRMRVRVKDPLPAGAESLSTSAIIDTVTPGDPSGDNTAQEETPIDTVPDLQIQAAYHSHTPYPGKRLTYTVRYTNAGHIATNGVVITASPSEHVTFDTGASDSCWQPTGGGRYNCSIGTMSYPDGGSPLFVVTLPTEAFSNTMSNFDAAFEIQDDGGSGEDENPGDNVFAAPLSVPDLIVDGVEVNWGSMMSGQSGYHVTVTLRNVGGNPACNPIPGPGGPIDWCGSFWVDLYINPASAPESYPSGLPLGDAFAAGGPVGPGETQEVPIMFSLPSGATANPRLYIRVDNTDSLTKERPFGLVPEYNEWNNVFGPIALDFSIYLPVVLRSP